MKDVHIARLAGAQFNRVSRAQLSSLGLSDRAIEHRVASGRLVIVHRGVFAVAPVLTHDNWGRWMAATLTAPGTILSHASAAAAWGMLSASGDVETVTRLGCGGPRRHEGVLVFRSMTLDGDRDSLHGIPITTPQRTLIDIAAHSSSRAVARALREAVRLQRTSIGDVADRLGARRGRRGSRRLGAAIARYSGLPVERARSGSEVRALEVLRDAGRPLPRLNVRIAGEEADLSWWRARLIIEIDGGPFHLDVGADARKQERWESAGWTVRRIAADVVYERPERLIALSPSPNVPRSPS